MRKTLLAGAAACGIAALAFWKFLLPPWNWVALFPVCALACALLALAVRATAPRYVLLTAMSVFLAIFGVEVYFNFAHQPYSERYPLRYVPFETIRAERNIPGLEDWRVHVIHDRPFLGYGPRAKAAILASRRRAGPEVYYDVLYRTLPSGWRVTPQREKAETGVVFFGCSFTFGVGLEDEQSFPYRVAEALGENFQVYNFGLPGYGGHQMLAMVENGYLDEIVKRHEKVVVYYTAIGGHDMRAVYEAVFTRGPRYELENGVAVLKGNMNERSQWRETLYKYLGSSQLFHDLLQREPPDPKAALERYSAMVSKADGIVRDQYHLPFTVILWPDAPASEARFKEELTARGVRCLDLAEALPQLLKKRQEYTLHKYDHHPNAAATALVAPLLVKDILVRSNN